MRLSTVFELLLIFLLIAFAAYGRVIDRNETLHRVARAKKQNFGVSFMSLKQATENVNKFCTCNENVCDCCRKFSIPLVKIQGPGCASLQYLKENNLAVQLKFGENILTSTIISGKKPRSICVPLPGGLSKFCSKIYSIEREAQNHFKACLAFELETGSNLEATIRVSCFRFGPDGVQLRPAETPPPNERPKPASDDDGDDYDLFGLYDDTDSDENSPAKDPQSASDDDDDDDEDDDDDDDVLGFGELIDLFTGGDDSDRKKTTTASPLLPFTIPSITKPSPTVASPPKPAKLPKPTEQIAMETKNPTKIPEVLSTAVASVSSAEVQGTTAQTVKVEAPVTEASEAATVPEEVATEAESEDDELTSTAEEKPLEESPLEYQADPTITPEMMTTVVTSMKTGVKKLVGIKTVKKPSLTSNSPNAIPSESKPLSKPIKPDPSDDSEETEDEEADYILASDSDEEDDETENIEESETEHDEEDEGEDDSEEEEDTVLSALVSDDSETKKGEKISDNETSKPEEDDGDYGMGLEEILARKRSSRRQWSGRQSKVMRLK